MHPHREQGIANVRNLLATLIGLLIGLLLLSRLPLPPDLKYESIKTLRQSCEVLFVGPSYVNSQVFTNVVDEEAARLGTPLSSCKYSRTAMKGYEMKHELELILAEPWPHLKLVMLDITLGPDSRIKKKNRFKPRVLRWHTWAFLPWLASHLDGQRTTAEYPRWLQLAKQGVDHVEHVLASNLLVGRGAEHLNRLNPVQKKPRKHTWPPRKPKKELSEKRKKKLNRLNKKRVERLRERRNRKETRLSPEAEGRWLKELRGVVRQSGAEADGLIAPVWKAHHVALSVFPNGETPFVHNYANPEKYPELYRTGAHDRSEHLSPEGSYQYSLLLADAVSRRLKELK